MKMPQVKPTPTKAFKTIGVHLIDGQVIHEISVPKPKRQSIQPHPIDHVSRTNNDLVPNNAQQKTPAPISIAQQQLPTQSTRTSPPQQLLHQLPHQHPQQSTRPQHQPQYPQQYYGNINNMTMFPNIPHDQAQYIQPSQLYQTHIQSRPTIALTQPIASQHAIAHYHSLIAQQQGQHVQLSPQLQHQIPIPQHVPSPQHIGIAQQQIQQSQRQQHNQPPPIAQAQNPLDQTRRIEIRSEMQNWTIDQVGKFLKNFPIIKNDADRILELFKKDEINGDALLIMIDQDPDVRKGHLKEMGFSMGLLLKLDKILSDYKINK